VHRQVRSDNLLNTMKIISGTLKGRSIRVPLDQTIEPVKSAVCNAIFSILGARVTRARCLDLFAGTGALGLEALSRGAASCVFVEGSKAAVETIQENLKNLDLVTQGSVVYSDIRHYLKTAVGKAAGPGWSLVFLDPPYATPAAHLLKMISNVLQDEGVVVYLGSRNAVIAPPRGLEIAQERCYGKTKAWILKKI